MHCALRTVERKGRTCCGNSLIAAGAADAGGHFCQRLDRCAQRHCHGSGYRCAAHGPGHCCWRQCAICWGPFFPRRCVRRWPATVLEIGDFSGRAQAQTALCAALLRHCALGRGGLGVWDSHQREPRAAGGVVRRGGGSAGDDERRQCGGLGKGMVGDAPFGTPGTGAGRRPVCSDAFVSGTRLPGAGRAAVPALAGRRRGSYGFLPRRPGWTEIPRRSAVGGGSAGGTAAAAGKRAVVGSAAVRAGHGRGHRRGRAGVSSAPWARI